MTNLEIIFGAMKLSGLDPKTTYVDTFAGWKRKGYSVKKGEKAAFKTKIWKPVKYTKNKENADTTEISTDSDGKKLVLVTAAFFTDEQVEKGS